ncbi:11260_t:CDS:2, partial [Funneliformis geosporum]
MKNSIDPMQPHYQKLISRKLENPEAGYPMHQKKWLILSSSDQPALDKNSQTVKTEQTLKVVSEISLPTTEISKKNSRKKKVKIDEKLVTGASSMVEKNNKNNVTSSADNLSDISREDGLDSLLENLVNRGEKLK